MSATITDSHLEEMMAGEAKCEARHGRGGKVPAECSWVPTHRLLVPCVGDDKLVCQVITEYIQHSIANGNQCAACMRPTRDHWSVTPA